MGKKAELTMDTLIPFLVTAVVLIVVIFSYLGYKGHLTDIMAYLRSLIA